MRGQSSLSALSKIVLSKSVATCSRKRMRLIREPGAGSGEREKKERGAGIVVRNPKIDKFHQK
jgi:hypothetical protein